VFTTSGVSKSKQITPTHMRHRETCINPTPEIHKCFDILARFMFKMTSNRGNSRRVLGIGQRPRAKWQRVYYQGSSYTCAIGGRLHLLWELFCGI